MELFLNLSNPLEIDQSVHDQMIEDFHKGLKFRFNLYKYAIPTMTTVCLCAMLLNGVVLWSARWTHRPFSPTLLLTLSLALADCWTATVLAGGLFCNSYLTLVHKMIFPYVLCVITTVEAVRLGSILTSVFHLAALSCTHYFAAAHGLRYHNASSKRNLTAMIVLMWIVPSAGFLIGFAAIPRYGYNSANCSSTGVFQTAKYRIPVATLVILPLAMMILLYIRIIALLKQRLQVAVNRRQSHRFTTTSPNKTHRANSPTFTSASSQCVDGHGHQRTHRTSSIYRIAGMIRGRRLDGTSPRKLSLFSARRAMRMSLTALILVGSFLITMLPACIMYLLTCSDCRYPGMKIPYDYKLTRAITIASVFSNLLIILKCGLNPFLYAGRIPEIKKALRAMMRSSRRMSPRTMMRSPRSMVHRLSSAPNLPLQRRLLSLRVQRKTVVIHQPPPLAEKTPKTPKLSDSEDLGTYDGKQETVVLIGAVVQGSLKDVSVHQLSEGDESCYDCQL